MSSLAATLLARSSATVQTRQALIVTGLQNDFISPKGKLPMSTQSGFIDRIKELVPAFREHGIIIWVWTEYRGNRDVNDPSGGGCRVMIPEPETESIQDEAIPAADPSREASPPRAVRIPRSMGRHNTVIARAMTAAADLDSMAEDTQLATSASADPELFLSETSTREACCKPGTWGAEPIPEIKDLIDSKDIQVTKSYYSAFTETSLLLQLRAKLITDLYFAGCNTNLSVYATATDVARHGLEMYIVRDCLGCRQMARHDQAVKQMVNYMGAEVTTGFSVMARLKGEEVVSEGDESDDLPEDEEGSQSPPMFVRQSPSRQQLEGPVLSKTVSSTASVDRADASVAASEHAEPSGLELAADTDVCSSSGREEDQRQTFTTTRELGRQWFNESKSMSSTGESVRDGDGESDTGKYRLGPQPRHLDERSEDVPMIINSPPPVTINLSHPHPSTLDLLHISDTPTTARKKMFPMDPRLSNRAMSLPERNKPPQPPPFLGPGDPIGDGDSRIQYELMPSNVADTIFQQLLEEVGWRQMYHKGGEAPRLVCNQGEIDPTHGSMPVYRHPSDCTLPLMRWTSGVARIRREAERQVGHDLNNVLIQLYRNGQDYIREHSDKTLDIAPESAIVNVSFGAQRTMRLRTKRDIVLPPSEDSPGAPCGFSRAIQRVHMPHNSMFVLGTSTNESWLHGITADKRHERDRQQSELAYGGIRISLTFRNIKTFISYDSQLIWGQGATGKTYQDAKRTINGDEAENKRLIDAFTVENQSTNFDWGETYGKGFDVLNMTVPPSWRSQEPSMFFLSGDRFSDTAVRLWIQHVDTNMEVVKFEPCPVYSRGPNIPTARSHYPNSPLLDAQGNPIPPSSVKRSVIFRDNDKLHTVVTGLVPILLYLDKMKPNPMWNGRTSPRPSEILQSAKELELLTGNLLPRLRKLVEQINVVEKDNEGNVIDPSGIDVLHDLEHILRKDVSKSSTRVEDTHGLWIAGPNCGIADCAFYPMVWLLKIRRVDGRTAGWVEGLDALKRWVDRVHRCMVSDDGCSGS